MVNAFANDLVRKSALHVLYTTDHSIRASAAQFEELKSVIRKTPQALVGHPVSCCGGNWTAASGEIMRGGSVPDCAAVQY